MNPEPSMLPEPDERLGDILAAWIEAAERGEAPDSAEWLARHASFAPELAQFLANRARLQEAAEPLRQAVRAMAAVAPSSRALPSPTSQESTGALPAAEMIGRSVGEHDLLEAIGQGGMGLVYRARHRRLQRLVALKMLRTNVLSAAGDVQRFRNEAEVLAQLDHPHIVPIHDVGEHEGRVYFSMKLIEGGGLDGQLERFRDDPKGAAHLVAQVARAVHHAHQRGILHRDLKPSNILLDREGQPHVSDFGLSKRIESDGSLTQTGAIVGTPQYMAPEQTSGRKGAVTTATDVYGLGAVLYALLMARPPFQGETVLETLEQVREREPETPHRINPKMDRDLETICLKCLQKEPQRRYESAQALAEDLERWLNGEPILARPISSLKRLWRWCGRNRVIACLLGFSGLLLMLGFAGLLIGISLLSRERDLADAHLREAREQRRQARQAVDTMYLEVAQKWLERQPQMGELQKQFLEKVLGYYQAFAEEKGEDEEARFDKATAYLRVGQLLMFSVGRNDQAQAPLQKAKSILEELADQFPDKGVYTLKLAEGLNLLAFSGAENRRQNLERAVSLLDELVERYPAEPEYRYALAIRLGNLGMDLTGTGQLKEAGSRCSRALALMEDLVRSPSPRPEYYRILAGVAGNLAGSQRLAGDWVEAAENYRKAVAAFERITPDTSGLPEYQHDLPPFYWHNFGSNYRDLGTTLGHLKRFEEAIAAFDRAVRIHAKLVADFPSFLSYWHALFRDYFDRGTMHWAGGQSREADQAYGQAVEFGDRMSAAFYPGDLLEGGYARFLVTCPDPKWRKAKRVRECVSRAVEQNPRDADAWTTQGIAAHRMGEHASAIVALEKAMALKGDNRPIDQFFLALGHWRLGDKRQAREWFDKATARMSETGSQDEELLRFRAEAAALLGKSESPPPSPQKKDGRTASD
jgi:tetratricopeptide (TPR) repeat protein/tRNA A-37 threonylcarbamoyl transferase component Bud32